MKEENKLRQKAKKVEPPNRTSSREVNVHEAMSSHLIHECKSHGNGFMFSLKASSHPDSNFQVTVASLEDHIHTSLGNAIQRIPVIQPAAKRHHMDVDAQLEEAFDDDLTPRGDDDLEVAHEQADVHFKVVYTSGGSMKLPMYPIASGRRLQQMDIVVSMHPVISQLGEEVSILNRPQHIAGYSPSQLGVLTLTDSDVEHLRIYSRRWTKGKGRFTWANIAATLDVIETVTRFVEAGALTTNHGKSTSTRISKHSSNADVLGQVHRVAELCPDMLTMIEDVAEYEAWCMTAKGTRAV